MILTLNSPVTVLQHVEYAPIPLGHTLRDMLYAIKT